MIRAIVVRKVSESNERDGGFLSLSLSLLFLWHDHDRSSKKKEYYHFLQQSSALFGVMESSEAGVVALQFSGPHGSLSVEKTLRH